MAGADNVANWLEHIVHTRQSVLVRSRAFNRQTWRLQEALLLMVSERSETDSGGT